MIVGVGGQGTLLASRVLGNLALSEGLNVKVSEVHGMAQRGGSVVTHVRFSSGEVASPLVEPGQADVILAFELLEGLRWADYLKEDGLLIVNRQKISPMPVITGAAAYPEDVEERLNKKFKGAVFIDALDLASQSGNGRTLNSVLMGALAASLDMEEEKWLEALKACVPPKTIEVNCKAFSAGYELMRRK
jgi:indolepyruvate ferredoxin oxidoreductase beta subunit